MIDCVIHGDSLNVLKTLADDSIDSLVTDPPAGISFMNKEFDHDKGGRDKWIAWLASIMQEALRVLKPGAHGLIWSLPRTSYWTATALEDAGFEIRDCVYHIFGSGFPKSLNVSKSLQDQGYDCIDGLGSGLKPAVECWWLVRKPLAEKSIAAQVLATGTGALNIDASRIDTPEIFTPDHVGRSMGYHGNCKGYMRHYGGGTNNPQGRFPSHLLLSHSLYCTEDACSELCPIAAMDQQSGYLKSGARKHNIGDVVGGDIYGGSLRTKQEQFVASEGGASRYFKQFYPFLYTPKASRRERNQGCEALPDAQGFDKNTSKQIAHINHETGNTTHNDYHPSVNKNNHPTVKNLSLMSYLIAMITPEHGIVLDPFAGSGSTLVAAIQNGHHYIGIEQSEEYVTIAKARIAYAEREGTL